MAVADLDAFRCWLTTQTGRLDAVGDFARHLAADAGAIGLPTISALDWHLTDVHGASAEVLRARDRAWREFAASGAWDASRRARRAGRRG